MKSKLINLFNILLLSIFFAPNLYSQSKVSQFEIGINTGFGVTNISSPRDLTTEGRFAYNFGVTGTYYFSETFGIKTKLLYDNKGYGNAEILDTSSQQLVNTDVNINYLTIPLMGSLFFGNNAKFYINAGPYMGLLLSAKETKFDTDLKPTFENSEFGIAAGIGVILPAGDATSFFIEYDSQYGISDPTAIETTSIRTRRHALNFGVLFLL